MSSNPILTVLDDDSDVERHQTRELRRKTATLVKNLDQTPATEISSTLPDALFELITDVIKPLFSGDQHSKLSSTGRKNLVDQSLPAAANRFTGPILFDDDDKPLWKNGWTFSLLTYVLDSYAQLQDIGLRKKTVEAHFYLLVPPILRQIDDVEITYKCYGLQCLKSLCDTLQSVTSDILKQSGLTSVFIDALKNDFSSLPTLTPEEDSLMIFQNLYPAFRSLLAARFSNGTTHTAPVFNKIGATVKKTKVKSDEEMRQSYLTLLLRHQCLHSLAHLSIGSGAGSSTSISLSTFLVSQISWIMSDMGIYAAIHLQSILPLLRSVLTDPFATSTPGLLLESAKSLKVIVQVCWVRIKNRWWEECLRGVIACWLNITDDETSIGADETVSSLKPVRSELAVLACLLEDLVGEELKKVKHDLLEEEPMLKHLFDINTSLE